MGEDGCEDQSGQEEGSVEKDGVTEGKWVW